MDLMMSGKDLTEFSVECAGVVRDYAQALVKDKVPMDKYVIQKTVRFDTKTQSLPHLQAVRV